VAKQTVFVKWGGSIITDKSKPLTPDIGRISALADELAPLLGDYAVLLGHGSGSFGHWAAKAYEHMKLSDPRQYAANVHAVAARLNQIVVEQLVERGLPAFQFPPSAIIFSRDDRVSRLCVGALGDVIKSGFLPVTYGDAVPDEKRGGAIFSTERVFFALNGPLKPRRIVLVTSVDGVYTSDPFVDPDAERIPEITPANFPEVRDALGGSHGIDVTGGMLSKVETMLALVQTSPWLESVVITSAAAGNMAKAVRGERVGTVIRGD